MKVQTKVATLAAAALLCAGTANAAVQLNIYGASAQGDFWVSEAVPFLKYLGCTTTDPANGDAYNKKIAFNSGSQVKYGFASGSGCDVTKVPGGSIEIRTAGIASLEGPLAVNLNLPLENEADDGCPNAGERRLPKDKTIATGTLASSLGCYKVHVGTSDLDAANINQVAFDNAVPPKQYPLAPAGTDFSSLTADKALVVPFSFVVNKGVTARHCIDTTGARTGAYCTDATQCPSGNTCETTFKTINNLSRLQAVMLFSGQVPTWKYLGEYFGSAAGAQGSAADITTKVCLRVPGSGTHAVLDKMIMSAGDTGWGTSIAAYNDPTGIPSVNYVKTSDDMVTCVNGAAGAVGYLDADKGISATAGPNVVKVNYNGNFPSRTNIRNGVYDYYSIGLLYTNPATLTADDATVYSNLLAFANDPANIPASKQLWWATFGEMQYYRGTDLSFPVYIGAATPATP
ncbi:MAG: hypothetical protein FD174_1629 [Geobacteraceae bacterium]|nr:MAG: hypothetical protein FD174_1629 [Geobacteraceae bacterium]